MIVNERIKMNELSHTREEMMEIRNICNEVLESHGENNSIGTYDSFIRRMINQWAGSGHDHKFLKSVIEKSFKKLHLKEEINDLESINETAGLILKTFNDSRGVGVVINGKKYVYLTNSSRIKSTFDKMRKYSDGRALSWLKKETDNNYIKVD